MFFVALPPSVFGQQARDVFEDISLYPGDEINFEFEDKGCGYGYTGMWFVVDGTRVGNKADVENINLVYMNDCGWGPWAPGRKGNNVYYHIGEEADGHWVAGDPPFRSNGWHSSKLFFTGRDFELYLDGKLLWKGLPPYFDGREIPNPVVGQLFSNSFCCGGQVKNIKYRNITHTKANRQIESTTPTPKPIEEWINDGLVAHYPFNGNANDESGNGNDATVENGPAGFGNDLPYKNSILSGNNSI